MIPPFLPQPSAKSKNEITTPNTILNPDELFAAILSHPARGQSEKTRILNSLRLYGFRSTVP
jgi:hypothetical protein